MRKIIFSLSIITALTTVLLIFNIAGGDEGETAGDRSNKEQKAETEETHSGGWQLQVMPNMGNRLVRDLYFTDSLTGYAVASPDNVLDSAHILKTTNGGFNWSIKYTSPGRLPRIIFLNSNTGYAGGNFLLKTTNAGENWFVWNWPYGYNISDMQIFNEDTIWFASSLLIGGGVYRTTNGGLNWEKRDSGIPANSYPDKLYFYNSRIGFATGNTNVYKTTDAGSSWNLAFTGGAQKLYFKDSLNGYRAMQGFFRTTNGGINWVADTLPSVIGNVTTAKIPSSFTIINNDIIYCVGAYIQFANFSSKAIIYKTTNGGLNWGYQIPDTSLNFFKFIIPFSTNKNNVWLYWTWKGVYSSTGGDSTIYLGITQISKEIPKNFELIQNYPNPFNAKSNIKYKILKSSNVKVEVMDILGRSIQTLINKKHTPGTYLIRFNGENLGSGIYLYQLIVDNKIVQTRRMILLK